MRTNPAKKLNRRLRGEAGQALVFVVLALAIFLLGAVGFAVDMANLWFHRQAAQTAADAACTAGAMDLLADATNGLTNQGGFTATAVAGFDCNAHPTYAPCQYAALNGYNSSIAVSSSSTGNNVYLNLQGTASAPPGVPAPPPALLNGVVPFLRVDVLDNTQTFFSSMLSGRGNATVRAMAVCGLQQAQSPIPIVVLNPKASGTFSISGTPTVAIVGGASRSIQVNSSNSTAITVKGSWGVNLECGGNSFTGSSLGVWGGPSNQTYASGTCPGTPIPPTFPTKGGGFYPGQTGLWGLASPVGDPFAQIPAPAQPPPPATPSDLAGNPNCTSANIQVGKCTISYHNAVHGCPDPTGCTLYTAGYYPTVAGKQQGITVQNTTGIFDPGVYYLDGGLGLQSNSMARPGTGSPPAPNNIGGTVFYLTGTTQKCSGQTGLVCVGSNSGKSGLDPFNVSGVQCPGGSPPDPRLGLPSTLTGNVFLAPCTGTYGDPLGQFRGILFFQDRTSNAGGGWGGGGGYLLAGSMYFHSCNASGTGTSCSTTVCTTIGGCAAGSYYGAQMTLQGGSGSTSYVLGEIITDALALGGTPTINMALNPNAAYSVLKVSLLQ